MGQIQTEVLKHTPPGSVITDCQNYGPNTYKMAARWLIAKGLYSEEDGNEQERLAKLRESWQQTPARTKPVPTPEAIQIWLSGQCAELKKSRGGPEIVPDNHKSVRVRYWLPSEPGEGPGTDNYRSCRWVIIEEGCSRSAEAHKDTVEADMEEIIEKPLQVDRIDAHPKGHYLPATRWLIANGFYSDIPQDEAERKRLLEGMGP
jgi:hypothetical protein